jgi:hypothetical protein
MHESNNIKKYVGICKKNIYDNIYDLNNCKINTQEFLNICLVNNLENALIFNIRIAPKLELCECKYISNNLDDIELKRNLIEL